AAGLDTRTGIIHLRSRQSFELLASRLPDAIGRSSGFHPVAHIDPSMPATDRRSIDAWLKARNILVVEAAGKTQPGWLRVGLAIVETRSGRHAIAATAFIAMAVGLLSDLAIADEHAVKA